MSTTKLPSIYDSSAVERLRRRQRLDPEQIRRLRTAVCKRVFDDATLASQVPLSKELQIHWLEVAERFDSQIDGATKLLMRTGTGMLIESVILRIDTGRTTVCVSSQVGCAAACDFCATGKMRVAHNLCSGEILDQVLRAGQLLSREGRRLRNIVLMGMGEPFHNESQVFEALRVLTSPKYFYHPSSRILVSSVGVVDGMIRCSERFPDVNLALSLHSVRQEVREKLVPVARKYPLNQLRSALESINARQSRPVMIEYLMLSELNDSLADADELVQWLTGLNVHVNLIPYNPIADALSLAGSDETTIHSFAFVLKQAGLKTTTRYSLGSDIAAACGQLAQRENRKAAKCS